MESIARFDLKKGEQTAHRVRESLEEEELLVR